MRDLIVEQLRTEIGNKMSTVNLAVATKLSDRILDEMTNALGVTSEHLVSVYHVCNLLLSSFVYGLFLAPLLVGASELIVWLIGCLDVCVLSNLF